MSEELLKQVADQGALVPGHWRLEMANALRMFMRRGRIDGAFRDEALRRLEELPIEVDAETDTHPWSATLRLADQHQLTLYDAAYLELALRRRVPLATRDRDLAAAAGLSGVTLLPTS